MAQIEDYEFPEFVKLGATVYTRDNRYNISRHQGKIVKVLKRTVDVEFTKYDGTVQIKRFSVESYGKRLNEISYKGSYVSKDRYYRDRLVGEDEALQAFEAEDHNKALQSTRREIEATAAKLAGKWITVEDVDQAIQTLQDLREKLVRLEKKDRKDTGK